MHCLAPAMDMCTCPLSREHIADRQHENLGPGYRSRWSNLPWAAQPRKISPRKISAAADYDSDDDWPAPKAKAKRKAVAVADKGERTADKARHVFAAMCACARKAKAKPKAAANKEERTADKARKAKAKPKAAANKEERSADKARHESQEELWCTLPSARANYVALGEAWSQHSF
eukprot:symbB.v1.2.023736.t1/scaffold2195.1/size86141/8